MPGITLGVDHPHANNDKPHRCSVTIQDNPTDKDQDYNKADDYFDEDLN